MLATSRLRCGPRNDGIAQNPQVRSQPSAIFTYAHGVFDAGRGVIEIVKPGYPDHTAFDRKHDHYDAASKPESPRWYMVDVRLKQRFSRVISLDELRRHESKQLRDMLILKRGNRLSITPVDAAHWKFILSLQ